MNNEMTVQEKIDAIETLKDILRNPASYDDEILAYAQDVLKYLIKSLCSPKTSP